jgi:anti-anti-sigma regulatory factor
MPRATRKSAGSKSRRKPASRAKADAAADQLPEILEAVETSQMDGVELTAPDDTITEADTSATPPESASECLMLPDCLDASAAFELKETLQARRGNALVIDASQVRRVGVQSLQILVASARTWQSDGQSYRVTNSSSELLDAITLIGLPHEELRLEGFQQ